MRLDGDQHFFDLVSHLVGAHGAGGHGGGGGQQTGAQQPPATVPRVVRSSFFIRAILESGITVASRSRDLGARCPETCRYDRLTT